MSWLNRRIQRGWTDCYRADFGSIAGIIIIAGTVVVAGVKEAQNGMAPEILVYQSKQVAKNSRIHADPLYMYLYPVYRNEKKKRRETRGPSTMGRHPRDHTIHRKLPNAGISVSPCSEYHRRQFTSALFVNILFTGSPAPSGPLL